MTDDQKKALEIVRAAFPNKAAEIERALAAQANRATTAAGAVEAGGRFAFGVKARIEVKVFDERYGPNPVRIVESKSFIGDKS